MSARASHPPVLPRLHPVIWVLLAFWAGLLHGWKPNYAAQPVVMFFSYGWLHAGPGHLIGNLGALVWLGPPMLARFGALGFSALWGACLLGGATGFALLTSSPAPMVGASGALFGLAGAWLVGEIRRSRGLQGGHLAWETHLGGLATGLTFAALWKGKNADERPDEGPPVSDQDI